MNRIIESYLKQFQKKFSISEKEEKTKVFEDFVNYLLISPRATAISSIEQLNIGGDSTKGIDGFALLLNHELINNVDELEDFFNFNKKAFAEIVFIQSKTSESFETVQIANFGSSVNDFVSEIQKYTWSDIAKEKISLFSELFKHTENLTETPICYLYYVSLGTDGKDQNNYAEITNQLDRLRNQNLFSKIQFDLVDIHNLMERFKKVDQKVRKSFVMKEHFLLPEIKFIKSAYIGLVTAKDMVNLITDESSASIMPFVFYDNIRDFQGIRNPVNKEIAATLNSTYKESFSLLNNGITIIAENLTLVRNTFTIENFQIVNGCQTTNVLFNNQNLLNENTQVVVKIIVTDNRDFISKIITSTNSQSAIKKIDLIAYNPFHKSLEDYYATFEGDNRLYYERRSKQYSSWNIEQIRIIDKKLLLKTIGSFVFDKPIQAARFLGVLQKELDNKLFKENHNLFIYYTTAYIYYKLECLFKNKKIEKDYWKLRFHIMTCFKYEIKKSNIPRFSNKKDMDKYCNQILEIVKDETKFLSYINHIKTNISLLGVDIRNNEVSKSSEFMNNMLQLYNNVTK